LFYFHKDHINFVIIGAKNPAINIVLVIFWINSGRK